MTKTCWRLRRRPLLVCLASSPCISFSLSTSIPSSLTAMSSWLRGGSSAPAPPPRQDPYAQQPQPPYQRVPEQPRGGDYGQPQQQRPPPPPQQYQSSRSSQQQQGGYPEEKRRAPSSRGGRYVGCRLGRHRKRWRGRKADLCPISLRSAAALYACIRIGIDWRRALLRRL
jgi:hypothetical protein